MGRIPKSAAILVLVIFFFFVFHSKVVATIVFSISNPVIDANDQIQVDASISGLIASSCSTSGCYLQAEFQSAGGYFGYTLNNSGDFVDYFKTPGSTDEIKSKLFNFIPVSGSWNGKLTAENNPSSSNYYGPGDYLLSFRRFSGNSTNPTSGDSNSISVSLTAQTPTPLPTDTPQPSLTPTPTPTPYVLKTPVPTPIPTPTPTPVKTLIPIKTVVPQPTILENISTDSGDAPDVLGIQNDNKTVPDPTPSPGSESSDNSFPFIAAGLTALGICFIGFSLFSIIKGAKKSYTIRSEKEDSQIS